MLLKNPSIRHEMSFSSSSESSSWTTNFFSKFSTCNDNINRQNDGINQVNSAPPAVIYCVIENDLGSMSDVTCSSSVIAPSTDDRSTNIGTYTNADNLLSNQINRHHHQRRRKYDWEPEYEEPILVFNSRSKSSKVGEISNESDIPNSALSQQQEINSY
mmetsp:Transcript_10642/g.15660  ORF Transcript_10642/g.15660 Transcript_10642/m.15660 type:complete len:159 (+) Transcript_10642:3-479(+)